MHDNTRTGAVVGQQPHQAGVGQKWHRQSGDLVEGRLVLQRVRQLTTGVSKEALAVLYAFALDGIAQRSHQPLRIDVSFDQVVLGALLHCFDSEVLVVQAAEDHDRHIWRRRASLNEGLEPGAIGQPQIQQHDVDAWLAQTPESARQAIDVGQCYGSLIVGFRQHHADQPRIAGVIFDQQNVQGARLTRRP